MKRVRKWAAWLSALALCMSLTAPALAANTTVYLDGYTSIQNQSTSDVIGSLECKEGEGQLSVTGDLERVGTINEVDMDYYGKGFAVPLYRSSKPVTVTLTAGLEEGGPTSIVLEDGSVVMPAYVISVGVNSVSYDSAKNSYDLKKSNVAYFQGNVGVDDSNGLHTIGTIQQVMSAAEPDDLLCIYKGATVTLSEPGIYFVYACMEVLEGACEVYIEITGDEDASTMTPSNPFTDVATSSPYYDAIQWAVAQGITTGRTATTFAPTDMCSVADILTFMWRAAGEPEPTIANPFTNVTGEEYYAKAAIWAAEQGLISGTEFTANEDCTRAMTMEYFWKQADRPETAVSDKFTDVPADAEYAQAVAWAVEKGITKGVTDTTFGPDNTCTRGQIVTFLYRNLA